MACAQKICRLVVLRQKCSDPWLTAVRCYRPKNSKDPLRKSSFMIENEELDYLRTTSNIFSKNPEPLEPVNTEPVTLPRDFRFIHPEFLPAPDIHRRDRIAEKLERMDMLRRRSVLNIPEFYVGSIIAVTVSDKYASSKENRFVGICIDRKGHGLDASFIIRNVLDDQGVEVSYELYNPVVKKIQVLKLEKRLDDKLYYLRDSPQQYSTFPLNMEPVPHPKGSSIPVNTVKIPLNPRPWSERWERADLQGVQPFEISEKLERLRNRPQVKKEWEKHDIMKQYRSEINDDEAKEIMSEVFRHENKLAQDSRKKR